MKTLMQRKVNKNIVIIIIVTECLSMGLNEPILSDFAFNIRRYIIIPK